MGITPLMVAKKLHMPVVDGFRVRARGAAASASEQAGPLLKKSAKRIRTVANTAWLVLGGLDKGMVSFWDRHDSGAHAAFLQWREDHRDDGFVINCKTGSEMWLHRARCSAFGFRLGTKVSLTRKRKICSLDRDQLERWARWQSGTTLVYCSRCAP